MLKLVGVQRGRARPRSIDGRSVLTAITKTPVTGAVAVGRLGLEGDEQADLTVHGGLAKAVYAYSASHYPFWQTVRAQARAAAWGEPLAWGAMGENLTFEALDERELWIGDRLQLPDCVLAVSEPRRPCFKFNAAMGFRQAARLMEQSGYCGAYLAVLEPGSLEAGQEALILPGPREVNLRELFRARTP